MENKHIIISMNVPTIIAEVQSRAHLVAEQTDGKDFELVAGMQPTDDNEVYQVRRFITEAFAECVEMLYPYSKGEIEADDEVDNSLVDDETLDMMLTFPKGFSWTTVWLIKTQLHEYIVCRVLAEWLGMTFPAGMGIWHEKAAIAKTKIQTSLLSRANKVRRKLKPF